MCFYFTCYVLCFCCQWTDEWWTRKSNYNNSIDFYQRIQCNNTKLDYLYSQPIYGRYRWRCDRYLIFYVGYGTITKIQYGAPVPDSTNSPLSFGSEILGTFMFIILYLIIMSASTKMQTNFWNYILVPIAFYISKMFIK